MLPLLCLFSLFFPNFLSTTPVSQITSCENPQNVFDGNVGIIFELLPGSKQKDTILQFVENHILKSKNYGLDFDSLTGKRHTLATTIPYPTTNSYNVQSYGSILNLTDVKTQVDNFNKNIQPVRSTGDIDDAFLYVISNLPAGNVPSVLIIIGNDGSMLKNKPVIVDMLQETFKIFTISIGDNQADLSSLSSGQGYSFMVSNGNDQAVADSIAMSIEELNPEVYCPSGTLISTTAFTQKPTTLQPNPCQCNGRWVYSGDLAVSFEFIRDGNLQQVILNFIEINLIGSAADSYGLSMDSNGNQPTKLQLIPYPDTNNYQIYPYGSITSNFHIKNVIDGYTAFQTVGTTPSIFESFEYINSHSGPSKAKAVILVAQNSSQVQQTIASADKLKANGYKVFTVNVDSRGLAPLSSGTGYSFATNGLRSKTAAAASIAYDLVSWSPICFEDPSVPPTTGCPSTTPSPPKCTKPYDGSISVVFELVGSRTDSGAVVSFIADNLYNSPFYKFDDNTTVAVNVPYPYPQIYATNILNLGDASSSHDMSNNMLTLAYNAQLLNMPTIHEGLEYVYADRPSTKSRKVLIIVGVQDTYAYNHSTVSYINWFKTNGYIVISVAVGPNHGNLASLASGPGFYFVVDDITNGQSIADQISSIICGLMT